MNTEFSKIFDTIYQANDADLQHQFFRAASNYARTRAEWYFLSPSERAETNDRRTALHNTCIDACNILSRSMAQAKEGNAWRAELGEDRKVIGDFACYVAYRLGVMMR